MLRRLGVRAMTLTDGGVVEFPEFVVYSNAALLPEYLVTYTHAPSCKCTHCIQLLSQEEREEEEELLRQEEADSSDESESG